MVEIVDFLWNSGIIPAYILILVPVLLAWLCKKKPEDLDGFVTFTNDQWDTNLLIHKWLKNSTATPMNRVIEKEDLQLQTGEKWENINYDDLIQSRMCLMMKDKLVDFHLGLTPNVYGEEEACAHLPDEYHVNFPCGCDKTGLVRDLYNAGSIGYKDLRLAVSKDYTNPTGIVNVKVVRELLNCGIKYNCSLIVDALSVGTQSNKLTPSAIEVVCVLIEHLQDGTDFNELLRLITILDRKYHSANMNMFHIFGGGDKTNIYTKIYETISKSRHFNYLRTGLNNANIIPLLKEKSIRERIDRDIRNRVLTLIHSLRANLGRDVSGMIGKTFYNACMSVQKYDELLEDENAKEKIVEFF